MGLRFRRSLNIIPGIRLNVSKSGVSTSIGVKGVHVTLGHGQVRETVGLPGTGLIYTHVDKTHSDSAGAAPAQPVPAHRHVIGILVLAGLVWFLVHLLRTGGAS